MEQKVVIDALRDHLRPWTFASLGVEPINRDAARRLVADAYVAVGLAPPAIVWCRGPMEIARRLMTECGSNNLGANIKEQLYDDVVQKAGVFAEIFWKDVSDAGARLAQGVTTSSGPRDFGSALRLAASADRAVLQDADDALFSPGLRARHFVQRLRGADRVLPRASFAHYAIGLRELTALGVYDYLLNAAGWHDPPAIKSLVSLGSVVGWAAPFEKVCFLAERPTALHWDDRARLHNATGPALAFADGWRYYSWKGVEVPRSAIEEPKRLDLRDVSAAWDPSLRNALVEIMSPERFVALGGARPVARDDTGILWRREWYHRGVRTGAWSAVEVIDGTPGPNGIAKRYFLRVPSHMRSAREAVAWTYGLSAREYAALALRT
jgi:hypothetical protein